MMPESERSRLSADERAALRIPEFPDLPDLPELPELEYCGVYWIIATCWIIATGALLGALLWLVLS